MVALAEGQSLVVLMSVRPGQDKCLPTPTALRHVDRTGNPAVAWKYLMKVATMGRSYVLDAANVAYLESLGILVRSESPDCRAIS